MGDSGCFRGVPTFATHLVSGPVGPALNCLVPIGTHTAARVAQDATTWLDRDMVGVVRRDQAPARSGTIFFFFQSDRVQKEERHGRARPPFTISILVHYIFFN